MSLIQENISMKVPRLAVSEVKGAESTLARDTNISGGFLVLGLATVSQY